MRELETKVNIDANNLIYNAQCAVDVTLLSTAQKSFAGLITNLNKADPAIRIFGLNVIDLHTNNIDITDPDTAYRSARTLAVDNLEKNITDRSRAYDILSTYQNLEKIAQYNRCYYRNQNSEYLWTEQVNDLERLSAPWVTVIEPDIIYNP